MRDLTHEQAMELLPEAALDALSADEQAAVMAHAANCAECAQALAALRDATAQLAYAVPSVPDEPARRARARTRLLARAHEIANNPTRAVLWIKELLEKNTLDNDLERVMEREQVRDEAGRRTADHREAVTAFREKREARFNQP